MYDLGASRWGRALGLLPVIALIVVALLQITFAHTLDLTPWKGGGFGMFASGDGFSNRPLRILAIGKNGKVRRLRVPPMLAGYRRSLVAMPTEGRLRRFAQRYVQIARWGEGVESLRVEVWRGDFDGNGPRVVYRRWKQVTVPVRPEEIEDGGRIEPEDYDPERDDPLDPEQGEAADEASEAAGGTPDDLPEGSGGEEPEAAGSGDGAPR